MIVIIFALVTLGRLVPAQPHDVRTAYVRRRRQPRGSATGRHQGAAPHGLPLHAARHDLRHRCSDADVAYDHRLVDARPRLELDAIAAVVIGGTLLSGGRGTVVGTLFGVLIFTTLSNVFTLNNLSTSTQNVAKGVIIVVAVLLQQRIANRKT